MIARPTPLSKFFLLLIYSIAGAAVCRAQPVLNRYITMNVKEQRLGSVLHLMEDKGKFQFSYNSNLIPGDSVVNIQVANQTVKDALDKLLDNRFEYREAENFVILRYAPSRLMLLTDKFSTEGQWCTISGYVADEANGKKLENASVYSRRTLESALTDAGGHFELRIKNDNQPVVLNVSKENYRDTSVTFLSELKVYSNKTTADQDNSDYSYLPGDLSKLENSRMGRLFISSKQKIQSLNLGGLIKQAPFQASLVPGLGTHGSLSGQVVNTISLNIAGGYNAGVNGVELGTFNLDKSDVQSFQLGVLFNTVGGMVSGVQIGGAFNQVFGNFSGVQVGGVFNNVNGDFSGVQTALGFNSSAKLRGVQTGLLNIARGNASGLQVGLMNLAVQKFTGIQFGLLFNYVRDLRGMQFGLINASDNSHGVSIGLINFVKNGYRKTVINTNETTDINLLYKTGTPWFYNIFLAGGNVDPNKKLFTYGLGYGNEVPIFSFLAFNTEVTARYLYQGDGRYLNLLYRIDGALNIKFGSFSVMAGPSLNFYYNEQQNRVNGYTYVPDLPKHYPTNNPHYTRWIGWTVGISLF
ncbi:MAG TPA: STN and carboxypeptidase regulatory-like domain-containing protein [Mucilaginibacter sp.]|nr:STN and carboxypeptidase regulatory-like domain-containing protein [Mucilaginibacter sp.]